MGRNRQSFLYLKRMHLSIQWNFVLEGIISQYSTISYCIFNELELKNISYKNDVGIALKHRNKVYIVMKRSSTLSNPPGVQCRETQSE